MPKKYIDVNELGCRIGESHPRAKLSNLDIDLMLTLLDARELCIGLCRTKGLTQRDIDKMLEDKALSYSALALRFGVHKQHVAKVAQGARRMQTPTHTKVVK